MILSGLFKNKRQNKYRREDGGGRKRAKAVAAQAAINRASIKRKETLR